MGTQQTISAANTEFLASLEPSASITLPAIPYLEGLFNEDDYIFFFMVHSTRKHMDSNGEMVADVKLIPLMAMRQARQSKTIQRLKEYEADGSNIYVCMNPFPAKTKARQEKFVKVIRNVFIESDQDKGGENTLPLIRQDVAAGLIPAPNSILSSSPGNYHIVWHVDGISPDEAKVLNRALASRFCGDMASTDLHRVLRLPGFRNLKYEAQPESILIEHHPEIVRYTREQFKINTVIQKSGGVAVTSKALKKIVGYLEANAVEAQFSLGDRETDGGGYKWVVTCPWASVHTRGGNSALIMLLGDGRLEFNCFHGHCNGSEGPHRGWSDIRSLWKEKVGHFQRFGEPSNEPISAATTAQAEVSTQTTKPTVALEFSLPAVTGGTHRDWVFEPAPGMYEGLFPRGAVSLIAATSGGGKTTLMIQALLAQRARAAFLGHLASVGYSFAMVGADRGQQDHTRTMESMHLPLNTFPFERIPMNALDRTAVQIIVNLIENLTPIPEIVFIEGLDMMVTNVNDMHIVSSFLSGLQKAAEHYHIAIIGSTGAPKIKEGQTYNITRENILGSGAWGRGSATVITMQFPNGDDSEGQRIVKVIPRRAKPERFLMEFQDGLLVVVQQTAEIEPEPETNPVGRPSIEYQKAIRFLERELQDGSPKVRADLCQKAKQLEGITAPTLDRAAAALYVIKDDSQDITQKRKPWRRTWAMPPMHEMGGANEAESQSGEIGSDRALGSGLYG